MPVALVLPGITSEKYGRQRKKTGPATRKRAGMRAERLEFQTFYNKQRALSAIQIPYINEGKYDALA
eukprot:1140472-Pelagomonas_calceolata.AAC.2